MRIILDLQGVQSPSTRERGIGRYSLAFSKALIRNRGDHEVLVALSGLFPETIQPIREDLSELLAQDQIRVWQAPGPVHAKNPDNQDRLRVAELIRESFLAAQNPDVVIISSLFDGYSSEAVSSVRKLPHRYSVGVIQYDLIPLIYRDAYLNNSRIEDWYYNRIAELKKADFLFAISDSAKREVVTLLGFPEDRVVNVRADSDARFRVLSVEPGEEARLRLQYGLDRPFVLYTGGMDFRKNVDSLIRAYAALPLVIRCGHQLVIVGGMAEGDRTRLLDCVRQTGLEERDVVLPGYVPDEDLVLLYNLCKLYVLPSFHEGFGLPVLEAMRCGAPVLGADSSSVPEIIGWKEALFDPRSLTEMSMAMERGLSDDRFRTDLVENGKKQAQIFSWDRTARTALEYLETAGKKADPQPLNPAKPRLAFVSPLPPDRSGISDYSADLIPYLAEFYQVDVIVDQASISDDWILRNCRIRSARWFMRNSKQYDRVLYQFGNSSFHKHMFGMLRIIPGVAVLHDFYLSGLLHYMDFSGYEPGCFPRALLDGHGYAPFVDSQDRTDSVELVRKYPCSLEIFQKSLRTVVHSRYAAGLAKTWYGIEPGELNVIPLLRTGADVVDRASARACLDLGFSDFVVCSFGLMGPYKMNDRLLSAWLQSDLARRPDCVLVFVGEECPGAYGAEIRRILDEKGGRARVRMTGWVDKNLYNLYLASADAAVQLRTNSRGETSAAALDCMSRGLATIVNNHGYFQDLEDDSVLKIPDRFTDAELAGALERLYSDPDERTEIGRRARRLVVAGHSPRTCAARYRDIIEEAYRSAPAMEAHAVRRISEIAVRQDRRAVVADIARSMARSIPPRFRERSIFVDISILAKYNESTGIQRVVRNIVGAWLGSESLEYRVEPVKLDPKTGFRYARKYVANLLGLETDWLEEPIDYYEGDIFIGLDWHTELLFNYEDYIEDMEKTGVRIVFVVYDLLPILLPYYFPTRLENIQTTWLKGIAKHGELYCISRSVADEVREWLKTQDGLDSSRVIIRHFPLGANIVKTGAEHIPPERLNPILQHATVGRKVFLMVGTVEPRKGHQDVLDAFDLLWRDRQDIVLVIVGKKGWMVDPLVQRISQHRQLGNLLLWFNQANDQDLHHLYALATALIAASYGEGFGLPLVEAAQHGLPIVARDISVFREVAGDHAAYFPSGSSEALASALQEWIELYDQGRHPRSESMPWITWEESAKHLYNLIVESEAAPVGKVRGKKTGETNENSGNHGNHGTGRSVLNPTAFGQGI